MSKDSQRGRTLRILSIALAGWLLSPALAADTLSLTVEPLYPPDQAAEVYEPLVRYLRQATGHDIQLNTPRDYQSYWVGVRSGQLTDLVLAEAPVTGVLLQRQGYQLVARVEEDVNYSMLTTGDRADDPLDAFVGSYVGTLASPSLGFLVLANTYDNPLAQPEFKSSARSWRDAIEMVFAYEAEAAMAPSWLTELYPNLYPVFTSDNYPGLSLSIRGDLDPGITTVLREALLQLADDPDSFAALNELNTARFVVGDEDDYDDAVPLLEVVFGFE